MSSEAEIITETEIQQAVPEVVALPVDNVDTLPPITLANEQETVAAKSGSKLNWLKRKGQQAIVAAELSPFTNEGSRFAAFAAATVYWPHNPLIGAAVLGGSTLLVEGAGALAATSVLTDDTDHRMIKWLNKKIANTTTGRHIPAGTESAAKAALTYHAGTPTLLTLEQAMHPEKPRAEVLRRGLFTASWLAGVYAVEGALISEGIDRVDGVPQQIASGVLTTAALAAVPYLYNRVRSRFSEEVPLAEQLGAVKNVVMGEEIGDKAINRLAETYEKFRNEQDEAVKIGLYGEDLKAAFKNPKAHLAEYQQPNGIKSFMPLLVPAEDLEWYNMDLLERSYGEGKEFYYYAHPPLPEDEASQQAIQDALKVVLEQGAIIFTDDYEGRLVGPLDEVANSSERYRLNDLGDDDKERNGQVFITEVEFKDVEGVRKGPSLQEVYKGCLERGELQVDPENGVSLAEVIEGDEAEKIWKIYKGPFDKLTLEHPMNAGFHKEELTEILADPNVAKIVNRVDGEITTLVFFQNDFSNSPWFNRDLYKEKYPEYYDTNNILIFPGIVTDESKRDQGYAANTINLALELFARRGTNILVTFECTEISATYIPYVVTSSINESALGHVEPIEKPVSKTVYRALQHA